MNKEQLVTYIEILQSNPTGSYARFQAEFIFESLTEFVEGGDFDEILWVFESKPASHEE